MTNEAITALLAAPLNIAFGYSCYALKERRAAKRAERIACEEAATIRPAVQLVIDLINTRKDWQIDKYKWFHPSGVCIWTANGTNHLRMNIAAKSDNDYPADDDPRPNAIHPNEAERAALWSAIVTQPDHVHSDAVAALAARITAMYDQPQEHV